MGKKFDFDFVPFTYDQIRGFSEEDLYRSIGAFRRRIKEALKVGKDTHPYEVELCYLDHERIMRDKGKRLHDGFVREKRKNSFNRRSNQTTR